MCAFYISQSLLWQYSLFGSFYLFNAKGCQSLSFPLLALFLEDVQNFGSCIYGIVIEAKCRSSEITLSGKFCGLSHARRIIRHLSCTVCQIDILLGVKQESLIGVASEDEHLVRVGD